MFEPLAYRRLDFGIASAATCGNPLKPRLTCGFECQYMTVGATCFHCWFGLVLDWEAGRWPWSAS